MLRYSIKKEILVGHWLKFTKQNKKFTKLIFYFKIGFFECNRDIELKILNKF